MKVVSKVASISDKRLRRLKRSITFLSGGKIQISNSTNMILDMQGGFRTEERGGVEMKVNKLHYVQIYLAM